MRPYICLGILILSSGDILKQITVYSIYVYCIGVCWLDFPSNFKNQQFVENEKEEHKLIFKKRKLIHVCIYVILNIEMKTFLDFLFEIELLCFSKGSSINIHLEN